MLLPPVLRQASFSYQDALDNSQSDRLLFQAASSTPVVPKSPASHASPAGSKPDDCGTETMPSKRPDHPVRVSMSPTPAGDEEILSVEILEKEEPN